MGIQPASHMLKHLELPALRIVTGGGWRVGLLPAFEAYYSPFDNGVESIGRILARGSDLIKEEHGTMVTRAERHSEGSASPSRTFVLKVHSFGALASWHQRLAEPISEREFHNLYCCRALGVPTVGPVGYGVQRSFTGRVKSCFLLTEWAARKVDMRAWLRQANERQLPESLPLVLGRVGSQFRRLHEKRYFLLTAHTRNVLVSDSPLCPGEPVWLDVPQAKFLRAGWAVCWAQQEDIVGFLRGVFRPRRRPATEEDLRPFFEAYLPDPLGESDSLLRRRILRACRSKRPHAYVPRLVQRAKAAVKCVFPGREGPME